MFNIPLKRRNTLGFRLLLYIKNLGRFLKVTKLKKFKYIRGIVIEAEGVGGI